MAELDKGYREEFHRGGDDSRVLGDEPFIEHVLAQEPKSRLTISLDHVIEVVCKRYTSEASPQADELRKIVAPLLEAKRYWILDTGF